MTSGKANPVLSALRCEYPELNVAAARLVRRALKRDKENVRRGHSVKAVQLAFDVSRNTAKLILREVQGD